MTTPSIYVGTYEKYNNGSIEGAWLDLTDYADLNDFYEACKELHKDEHDPEFMFQDWEGIPEGWISEGGYINHQVWEAIDHDDPEALAKIAGFQEAFGYLVDIDEMIERCVVEAEYQRDFEQFLLDTFYECNDIPPHLEGYIDEDKVIREWSWDYTRGGGYVYSNN